MKTIAKTTLAMLATLSLAGCLESGSSASHSAYSKLNPSLEGDRQAAGEEQGNAKGARSTVRVKFDPSNQVIPFPNNLLFEAGATTPADLDGTLNAPIADPEDSSANVAQALNDMDGFSTVESWRIAFTDAIDANSLVVGKTVRIFEMTEVTAGYPERLRPSSVARELSADDMQINYDSSNFVLYLQPKKPLQANRTYSAILVKGILDTKGLMIDAPIPALVAKATNEIGLDNGKATGCDGVKADVKLLQCVTFYALNPVLSQPEFKLTADDVLVGWSVTTARSDEAFKNLAKAITSNSIKPTIPSGYTCNKAICFLDIGSLPLKDEAKTPGEKAYVFPGTIRLPIMTAGMKAALGSTNQDYFLGKARLSRENSQEAVTGAWSCDGKTCNSDNARSTQAAPTVEGWVTYPFIFAAPIDTAKCPATGCPVVIFQHAIQQDRTNALALADALAEQGFAVIAIDMPFHGLVKERLDASNAKDASRAQLQAVNLNDALYNSTLNAARDIIPLMVERTLYMDLVSDDGALNDDGTTKSDSKIDASGAHFLNPSLPLAQRDILREASLDLVVLAHYLRTGNMAQCGINGLSKSCNLGKKATMDLFGKVDFKTLHFVGHSVGNLAAAPFLAFDKDIKTISMLAPSGATMRTLEGSSVIGPKLASGLAAKGVLPGTENYYRFFTSVQAAIDSVEPLNHAQAMRTRLNANNETEARPIYMAVIAGNAQESNKQDQVLPLFIANQPLAGSQALISGLGLAQASSAWDSNAATLGDGTKALQTVMHFKRGDHASFLLPKEEVRAKKALEENRTVKEDEIFIGEDVHAEMQRQVANFLKNNGQKLTEIKFTAVQ